MKRKTLRTVHIDGTNWKYQVDGWGAKVYSPTASKGSPPIRIFRDALVDVNIQLQEPNREAFTPATIKAAIEILVLGRNPTRSKENLVDQQTTGIYQKFQVKRLDRRDTLGGDRADADYFVLDLKYDPFAREAMMAYIMACRAKYPVLASELTARIMR